MLDAATLASLPPQVLAAYLRDPQLAMSTDFITKGTDTSPVKSPWEGLARAVKAGIGGYMAGQLRQDYSDQAGKIAGERSNAIGLMTGKPAETQSYGDGTTINWNAQAPNMGAAMATLGPGNQELQDKLLGFENEKNMKGVDLANAIKVKDYEYKHDPEKAIASAMADYLRGTSSGAGGDISGAATFPSPAPGSTGVGAQDLNGAGMPPVPADQLAPPVAPPPSPSRSSAPLPPPPMPMGIPGGAQTPAPAGPADGISIPFPPPPASAAPMPAGPTVGQVTQGQQPTVGGVTGQQFSPMGAMLAEKLGLKNMQLVRGPNGQLVPMNIPGVTKFENGMAVTQNADGSMSQSVPKNPDAQKKFEGLLADIADNIEKLHQIGGTVEEAPANAGIGGDLKQFGKNIGTQIAASKDQLWGVVPGGQTILKGTQAQTLRDNIQNTVKQALPLYMQAMGITPGMERAQSAQQMLLDALGGAVTQSRPSLYANLAKLSKNAGTGQLAQQLTQKQNPQDDLLSQARDAIAKGADPQKVIERLQQMGVNPQ